MTPADLAAWNAEHPVGTRVGTCPGSRKHRVTGVLVEHAGWPGVALVRLDDGQNSFIAVSNSRKVSTWEQVGPEAGL